MGEAAGGARSWWDSLLDFGLRGAQLYSCRPEQQGLLTASTAVLTVLLLVGLPLAFFAGVACGVLATLFFTSAGFRRLAGKLLRLCLGPAARERDNPRLGGYRVG